MVLTVATFKLKLFDLIDFIGWNIKGNTRSASKGIGFRTSEFVTKTQLLLFLLFIRGYLKKMKLYSVIFYF